jgi:hypothetical protein
MKPRVALAASLVSAIVLFLTAAVDAQPAWTVVMSGLDNPRGLT